MEIQVSWSRKAGVLVASLAGRVDSANCAAFQNALEEGAPEDEKALVIDCEHLSYMSSAGLRVLLVMARRFRGSDKAIGMCSVTGPILSVLSLSGFDKIIAVHGSQNDAIRAITGEDYDGTAEEGGDAEDAPEAAEGTAVPLQSSVDLNVVGDNIADIARYTIEKYEFANENLSAEVRAEALSAIRGALWEEVKRLREQRRKILAGMFRIAATTLDDVVVRRS